METMTVTGIERQRAWSREELARLPDGGLRYEALDGVLIVSAAPAPRHQFVVMAICWALQATCPRSLRVVAGPLDVVLDEHTVLEPDLLVARRDAFDARGLPGPPELAVEVVSPSSRGVDRLLKRDRYERAGTPAYWVVDPDALVLDAYELRDGAFVHAARVGSGETWTARLPFDVTLSPGTWAD